MLWLIPLKPIDRYFIDPSGNLAMQLEAHASTSDWFLQTLLDPPAFGDRCGSRSGHPHEGPDGRLSDTRLCEGSSGLNLSTLHQRVNDESEADH